MGKEEIINFLKKYSPEPFSAKQISDGLGFSIWNISLHLKGLRKGINNNIHYIVIEDYDKKRGMRLMRKYFYKE